MVPVAAVRGLACGCTADVDEAVQLHGTAGRGRWTVMYCDVAEISHRPGCCDGVVVKIVTWDVGLGEGTG